MTKFGLTPVEAQVQRLQLRERKCECCQRAIKLSTGKLLCSVGLRWPAVGICHGLKLEGE